MQSMSLQAAPHEQVILRKLVWVGPLTIVMVALANLVIRALAVAFFGVPAGFGYLQAPVVITGTLVYLLLALLAFVLVGRFARRPILFYRILAAIALVLSFATPILALSGALAAPGMDLHIFWTMIVMHVTSAVITVSLLTTLTPGREGITSHR
jgi:hypothetical protein